MSSTDLIDVVDVLGVGILVKAKHTIRVAILRLDARPWLPAELAYVADVVTVPRIHGAGGAGGSVRGWWMLVWLVDVDVVVAVVVVVDVALRILHKYSGGTLSLF